MHIVLDHLLKNLLLYKKKWLLQIPPKKNLSSAAAELLLGATTLTKSKWHLAPVENLTEHIWEVWIYTMKW